MADSPWPSEWLRGVLEPCVLAVLAEGPSHGYAITTRLAAAGLGQLKGGTLYPLLARLEGDGLVTARWHPGDGGPGRKVFSLTVTGRTALRDRAAAWTTFTDLTGALVGAPASQEAVR